MRAIIILPFLSMLASFTVMGYIVVRRVLSLARIPKEDILIDETLGAFLLRNTRLAAKMGASLFHFKKQSYRILIFLEKLLRKIKVIFLRTENLLNALIKTVRQRARRVQEELGIAAGLDDVPEDEAVFDDDKKKTVSDMISEKDR
ncbi:MAG: hypothetical protein WC289_03735 [Patescibacteria group bacterium]|jgi:hypothetical protein